jgi:hypothetical protein
MFLLDMCEESWVGEIPLAARAAEFALLFFLGLDVLLVVASTLLLTH